MASLYVHHVSLPLSPPHQLTAPEPPRAPPPSSRLPAPPCSSHHVSALPRPAVAPSSAFARHCKAPGRDHDADLLRALQPNGNNGTLHPRDDAAPPQALDLRSSDGPGGGRRPRFCARDCARRIMELPVEERVKVLDLLPRADDDVALTVSDYNDILSALARAGDHATAVALFRAMPVAPDAQSFATAVRCLCRQQGAADEAKLALDEMVARGFRPSAATFSAVVGCLCKRGRVTKAMEVLDAMRALGCEPTIRTYNSLVGGLCYVGRLEEALDLLNKLKASSSSSPSMMTTPDIYTFTIVLDGFCKVGRTEEATAIFHDALRMGLSPTIFTYNALLNGHCREGNPLRAFALLTEMCGDAAACPCPPDKVSFGIVLTALLRAGETSAALQTYRRMERAGLEADGRALDTLARGLCRRCATATDASAALGDAKEVFAKVVASGHEPVSYTYCLMAQALARGGEVDAAVALLEDMVRRGYALRKRAYTDVVRALCDRGRARDALRVLVLVMVVRDFVPGRNAFEALLGELSRQGRWADAMAVYAAAVKRGVVVSWKHLGGEAPSPGKPVRLGVGVLVPQ